MRPSLGFVYRKLEERVIDFDTIDQLQIPHPVQDEFCMLGTKGT